MAQAVKRQVESWSWREDLGTDHANSLEGKRERKTRKETGYQMSCRIFVDENEALAQVAKCQERRQLGNEQDGFNSDTYLRCSCVVVRFGADQVRWSSVTPKWGVVCYTTRSSLEVHIFYFWITLLHIQHKSIVTLGPHGIDRSNNMRVGEMPRGLAQKLWSVCDFSCNFWSLRCWL